MAVLTYQLFSKSNLLDMEYNCIDVFQKEEDGNWYAIHSTWSIIRPMYKDFSKLKKHRLVFSTLITVHATNSNWRTLSKFTD